MAQKTRLELGLLYAKNLSELIELRAAQSSVGAWEQANYAKYVALRVRLGNIENELVRVLVSERLEKLVNERQYTTGQ